MTQNLPAHIFAFRTVSRRQQKLARKREEILRAAARVFRKKGYHAATMEDIASELLMTQGSLYYYFKSKEEILFTCHYLSMKQILATLEYVTASSGSCASKLRTLIESHVRAVTDELLSSAMALELAVLSEERRKKIVAMRDRYEAGLRALIREGVEKEEFLPVNPRLVGFTILGAINWIPRWFSVGGPLPAEEVATNVSELFLRALGVDPTTVSTIPLPEGL